MSEPLNTRDISKQKNMNSGLGQIISLLQDQFEHNLMISQALDKFINNSQFNPSSQVQQSYSLSPRLNSNHRNILNPKSLFEQQYNQQKCFEQEKQLKTESLRQPQSNNQDIFQDYNDQNVDSSNFVQTLKNNIKKEQNEDIQMAEDDQQTMTDNLSQNQEDTKKQTLNNQLSENMKQEQDNQNDFKLKGEDLKPTVKKIIKKKKIEKIKKKFCISQNQSFNQDSIFEEIGIITKPDIQEDTRNTSQNQQKFDFNQSNTNFQSLSKKEENENSSEQQKNFFQNSPPIYSNQRQFYDILQSSYQNNRFQDSFQKQFMMSNFNNQNQYYQSSEKTKQTPSPFTISEYNQSTQNQCNNLSYFYSENKVYYQDCLKQYGNTKSLQLLEDNRNPQNKSIGQIKTENIEEVSSQMNESFSDNSQAFKKSKKFPSVIYIEGNKKFQCQICKKTFDSKQKLGGHKARSHPDAPCQRTEREEKKKRKILESEAITPSESNTVEAYEQFKKDNNNRLVNYSNKYISRNKQQDQSPQVNNYQYEQNISYNNSDTQNTNRNTYNLQQQEAHCYSFQPKQYSQKLQQNEYQYLQPNQKL